MSKWLDTEIEYLKNNYPNNGSVYCANYLNRTKVGVQTKAKYLGLKFTGINHNFKDITDIKYGKLTPKSIAFRKKQVHWNCICDCGKEKIVRSNALISGIIRSCGCLSSESECHYTGGKYITGYEFRQIKRSAAKRDIDFNLTIEEIEEVYEKQNKNCAFTGEYVFFNSKINSETKIIGSASIDRKDSSKEYCKDNIQIVHKDINMAKRSKSDKDFIDMCRKVVQHTEIK